MIKYVQSRLLQNCRMRERVNRLLVFNRLILIRLTHIMVWEINSLGIRLESVRDLEPDVPGSIISHIGHGEMPMGKAHFLA